MTGLWLRKMGGHFESRVSARSRCQSRMCWMFLRQVVKNLQRKNGKLFLFDRSDWSQPYSMNAREGWLFCGWFRLWSETITSSNWDHEELARAICFSKSLLMLI